MANYIDGGGLSKASKIRRIVWQGLRLRRENEEIYVLFWVYSFSCRFWN